MCPKRCAGRCAICCFRAASDCARSSRWRRRRRSVVDRSRRCRSRWPSSWSTPTRWSTTTCPAWTTTICGAGGRRCTSPSARRRRCWRGTRCRAKRSPCSRSRRSTDPARLLFVVGRLARAIGAEGLVGGQQDDLAFEAEMSTGDPTVRAGADHARLASIHERKTAALFQAAIVGGAVLGGADRGGLRATRGLRARSSASPSRSPTICSTRTATRQRASCGSRGSTTRARVRWVWSSGRSRRSKVGASARFRCGNWRASRCGGVDERRATWGETRPAAREAPPRHRAAVGSAQAAARGRAAGRAGDPRRDPGPRLADGRPPRLEPRRRRADHRDPLRLRHAAGPLRPRRRPSGLPAQDADRPPRGLRLDRQARRHVEVPAPHRIRIRPFRRRPRRHLDLRRPRHGPRQISPGRARRRDRADRRRRDDGGHGLRGPEPRRPHRREEPDRRAERQRDVDRPERRRALVVSLAQALGADGAAHEGLGAGVPLGHARRHAPLGAQGRGVAQGLLLARAALRGAGLPLCRPDPGPPHGRRARDLREREGDGGPGVGAGPDPRDHREGPRLRARRSRSAEVPRRGPVRRRIGQIRTDRARRRRPTRTSSPTR